MTSNNARPSRSTMTALRVRCSRGLWADTDADALVAGYAEDVTAILPDTCLRDKETIRANMVQAFAGPLKGSRAVPEVRSIRFVGAEAAVVTSKSPVVLMAVQIGRCVASV